MSTTAKLVRSQIRDINARLAVIDRDRQLLLSMKKAAAKAGFSDSPSQSGVSTGFRDAIRQSLKGRPQGLTGREIIQGLRSSGTLELYQGATKPSVRVHNELFALAKKGEVIKKGKRYMLKEPQPKETRQ